MNSQKRQFRLAGQILKIRNFYKIENYRQLLFLQKPKKLSRNVFFKKSYFEDLALCNYQRSVKSAILNSTFGKLRFPIELFRNLKFLINSVKSTILNCTFVKLRFPTAHFR